MEKYFKYNKKLKDQMVKKWINSQKSWRVRKNIAGVLFVLGVLIIVSFCLVVTIGTKGADVGATVGNLAIAFGTGLIFGCIPIFVGQAVYIKGKRKFGEPYISMTNEFLFINDSGFQLGFHNTANKLNQSMDVYQIANENITRIYYDQDLNLLTIIGSAELIAYDDLSIKRINYANSQRKFYNNSPFSFILAFDEQQEFLDEIIRRSTYKEG